MRAPVNAGDVQTALGLQREVVLEGGRTRLEYLAGPHMCHSGGVVQGGFISGWLDAAMAHAAIAAAGHGIVPMSLELKVSFFAPTRPGLVFAEGWVERMGRSTCFLEAQLTDAAGEVLAKASSTARLMSRAQVTARATEVPE
jgi:acyl-CoA thioesterase